MKNSIQDIKKKAISILKRHGVKRAAIFGSAARKETKNSSDIDIVVEIEKDISLLDFVGLKLELEEILGKKVDLVEYNTLKSFIKERVLEEQQIIL